MQNVTAACSTILFNYLIPIKTHISTIIALVIFRTESVQVVARPAMLNEQCKDVTISRTLEFRHTCLEIESFYSVEFKTTVYTRTDAE